MANVRVAHRGAPIRPLLPNYRAGPIRPSLPNRQATPIRPPLSNPQANPPRPLINHRPHTNVKKHVSEYIPVLQPPIFPREDDFYEEEEQEEIFYYPTVVVADQYRTITQQLPHRAPTLVPLRKYTKKSLTRHHYKR